MNQNGFENDLEEQRELERILYEQMEEEERIEQYRRESAEREYRQSLIDSEAAHARIY